MHHTTLFRLAIAGLFFCSCQSDSFQIKGQSDLLTDGDTICLIDEKRPNIIIGSAITNDEKFEMRGTVSGSPTLCRIYVKRTPTCCADLFLEPGNIIVEFNQPPKQSRVSGTQLNNKWQKLNDSIKYLGRELIHKSKSAKGADPATHESYLKTIDSLHKKMSECILNTAKQNRNNALGKYIQENYKEPKFK